MTGREGGVPPDGDARVTIVRVWIEHSSPTGYRVRLLESPPEGGARTYAVCDSIDEAAREVRRWLDEAVGRLGLRSPG